LNGERIRTTRQVKLQSDYNLIPRTLGDGSYKIGWKRGKVATKDYYAILHWTDPTAAKLFLVLFRYYLHRREAIMQRRRALGFGDHPFLFISEQEARNRADGAKFIGAPASIESYETTLERGVRSVGAPYGWELGTTSHALRHLYASTLRRLGLSRKIQQEGLRHINPLTSDRYGIPSPAEIDAALNSALAKPAEPLPPDLALSRTFEWIEERYPEYVGRAM
jgi:integrase